MCTYRSWVLWEVVMCVYCRPWVVMCCVGACGVCTYRSWVVGVCELVMCV